MTVTITMRADWTIVGRAVHHRQCGVEVRFEGAQGAYSGHGPIFKLKQVGDSPTAYYVPPMKLVNHLNPYHTKNWHQLLLLVEEARAIFEGHL